MLTELRDKIEGMKALEAEKKERRDQIKLNRTKPSLARLKKLLADIDSSPFQFQGLTELRRQAEAAEAMGLRVREFLGRGVDWQECEGLQSIQGLRDEADALRKQIMFECGVGLDEEVSGIYRFEIKVRICLYLRGQKDKSKLDRCQKLLQLAEEEGLSQTQFRPLFLRLKEFTSASLRFSKEVAAARNLQKSLANQVERQFYSVGYANCFSKTR